MKHLNLWLIIAYLIFNFTAISQAEQRLALVIGNADYLDGSELKNPVNDAEDLTKVLRHLDFEVILEKNLNQKKMETVVSQFGQKLRRDKDTVGLFYFSGHGVQHNGENYLIPIGGMELDSPQQLPYKTVNANYVLDEMIAAKNQMNIVILDACRYNIFKSKFKGKMDRPGDPEMNNGLAAPQQTPTGFLIAYATAANDFASDFVKDGDRNSPYLKHLKCQMQKHNLIIEQMFKQVRIAVQADTNGSQEPTYYAAINNDFFFVPQGSRIEAIQGCVVCHECVQLLRVCEGHFQAHRLTTGVGGTALSCYKEVLEKEPNNSEALAGLKKIEKRYITWIEAALSKGRKDKAKQYLEGLRRVNPESPSYTELEERIYPLLVCEKQFKALSLIAATSCYKNALEKEPIEALAGLEKIEAHYITLIEAALSEGRKDKAKQYLEELRGVNPESPSYTELKEKIYPLLVCEKQSEALNLTTATSCYKNVLEKEPNNIKALAGLKKIEVRYITLIEAALSEGRKDKAKQYLEGLREVNPESSTLAKLAEMINPKPSPVKPSFFEKAWEILVVAVIIILLIWIGWQQKKVFKKAINIKWKKAVTKLTQLKMRIWWYQLDNNWKNVFKEAINIKREPSDDELVKIVNLHTLDCRDNQIINLKPLRALTNLQTLDCSYNWNISDLEPLRALTNLQTLDCGYNEISDLEPLRALTKLQTLHCSRNKISDLEPLRALTNLQTLHCHENKISDLEPLRALTNLQTLDCRSNKISNLEPLRALTKLQELDCSRNKISDSEPLRALTNLQKLSCRWNKINDLELLRALTNLQKLSCQHNKISDLKPLRALTNLQTLDCRFNQISDLEPLRALTNLQTLYCRFNQISDLEPLHALTNLQTLDCRSNQISDLELKPGLIIRDNYRLEEELGEGGMGVVWKAIDLIHEAGQARDSHVAIKFFSQDFKQHPDALKALVREFRRYTRLTHPNIVKAYGLDRLGNTFFMVMELLKGIPLNEFLKSHKNGVSIIEAQPIIKDMANALEHAHQKGIAHLDFKPANVFYDPDEKTAKVIDFGVVRPLEQSERDETQFDPGTLQALTDDYASYETLLALEPDQRDDIYSLACVTYELLSGKHPFNRKKADMAKYEKLSPKPIKGLTKKQNKALLRGLAFHRDDRTPTATQFLAELFPEKKNFFWVLVGGSIIVLGLASFAAWEYFKPQPTLSGNGPISVIPPQVTLDQGPEDDDARQQAEAARLAEERRQE
jgi:Leucine-rich repeat (LRR) protein/serine/threonine protein kinase